MSQIDGNSACKAKINYALKDKKYLTGINKEALHIIQPVDSEPLVPENRLMLL